MSEGTARSPSRAEARVLSEPWVHRSAAGVEIGSEIPSGTVRGLIPTFISALASSWSVRETLWLLVMKDFKGRYRAQALGLFWSFAHPLVMMITMTVAFRYILRVQIEFFPVFYLIGGVFWQFFTNSILAACGSIVDNAGLVKGTTFPRHLLPVATVLSHAIHLGMELVLVIAFFFVFPGAYRFNVTLVALPVLVLLVLIIAVGLGLATSVLFARYRDTFYILTSFFTIGFWVSPILYSTAMAPAGFRTVLRLNPVGGVIESARDVLMHGAWPNPEYLIPGVFTALVVFFAGCFLFHKRNPNLSDYV